MDWVREARELMTQLQRLRGRVSTAAQRRRLNEAIGALEKALAIEEALRAAPGGQA